MNIHHVLNILLSSRCVFFTEKELHLTLEKYIFRQAKGKKNIFNHYFCGKKKLIFLKSYYFLYLLEHVGYAPITQLNILCVKQQEKPYKIQI